MSNMRTKKVTLEQYLKREKISQTQLSFLLEDGPSVRMINYRVKNGYTVHKESGYFVMTSQDGSFKKFYKWADK